jgi:hypothetical protein
LQFGGVVGTIGPEKIGAESVKNRIAVWASAGFLIAASWGLYFANADKGSPIEPPVYALAILTQPVAAIASSLKFPVGLHWVLVANAVTYALVGLIVETLRPKMHHAS